MLGCYFIFNFKKEKERRTALVGHIIVFAELTWINLFGQGQLSKGIISVISKF
jgi:hypothetical protein